MDSVLVIDDNDAIRSALELLFDLHDIPCVTAESPEQGLELMRTRRIGVVVQDMNFTEDSTSGEEGIRLFRQLRQINPTIPILLITAWTSLESAVMLVKEGAYDYLSKPWDDARLLDEVSKLLASNKQPQPADGHNFCGLVFADPVMERLVNTALRVAASDLPVLITGPNGSGKEMLAQLVRANSKRKDKPFLTVNAGGLPNELLESELFGSEAGAFTGARKRVGRFEEANGGTLFLDEIGNLPMAGQAKLLRVLQSGEYSRLGSNRVLKADVRVVSATNTDLLQAIRDGSFREDLYFRLNVVELAVPPLSERTADIPVLARHFLFESQNAKTLSPEAEQALCRWHWPGNVRELHNRIQRAVLISQGSVIQPEDLSLDTGNVRVQGSPAGSPEAEAVSRALEEADGNVSKAAAGMGLSRQAFYRRMEKYDIVWERRPKG